ncbi:MAG: IS66 family transposase [Nanoarchaeota archaeon]
MVCDNCKEEFEKLTKRIEELERRLAQYENANTPSSRIRFPPRIVNFDKKKPGQKEGHDGTTRAKPFPTMSIELIEEKCPSCNSKLGNPFKTISKIVEEIPEPQPVIVTEYKINHYKCKRCNKEVIAQSPFPEQSNFGANTLAHVTLLKFDDRLPLKKVCSALKRQFNLDISSATVLDITRRVSDKLQPEYESIKNSLRRSKSVNIDETGMRVGGLNFHLWVFTNEGVTLYVIRKSRGKDVIEEVLGKNYKGVIGSDGWASYASYTDKIQRCWAHLLREAKYLANEHDSAKSLYEGLKKIYEKATGKKPPSKKDIIIEMQQWIDYAQCYKELRKFAITIGNGIEHWFTFLDYKNVAPTNNRAERALREMIVQRKIMGTLRNEKGTTIMERIVSCIATWKQKGLNPFYEIKANLC